MSSLLLVVADSDASILQKIVTLLSAWNKGVLHMLLSRYYVLIYVLMSVWNAASRSNSAIFSGRIATGRGWLGTLLRSIREVLFRNLSIKYVPMSNSSSKPSRMPKWTRSCRSPRWTIRLILPISWKRLSDASLRDTLCMGQMWSRHLSRINDVQTVCRLALCWKLWSPFTWCLTWF